MHILNSSRQREVFKSKSAVNLSELPKDEETMETGLFSSSDFLGHSLFHHTHSLPGNIDDSVFLPPISSKATNIDDSVFLPPISSK